MDGCDRDEAVAGGFQVAALARVLLGMGVADPVIGLAARVLAAMKQPVSARGRAGIEDLTKREEDILRRIARGLSNRETAAELGLQEKTVKHYMTIILEKLQARNRVEAALIAREAWGGKG